MLVGGGVEQVGGGVLAGGVQVGAGEPGRDPTAAFADAAAAAVALLPAPLKPPKAFADEEALAVAAAETTPKSTKP